MNRSYSQGWEDIFGKRPVKHREQPQQHGAHVAAELRYAEPPHISFVEVDWKSTRALSIRQPWAEQIVLGGKAVEYRGGRTNVRGRIAIYASLGRYNREEEEELEDGRGSGARSSGFPSRLWRRRKVTCIAPPRTRSRPW